MSKKDPKNTLEYWVSKKGPRQEIKIEDIGIDMFQVRTDNVVKDLDELKQKMQTAGTNLEAICVAKMENEDSPFKYDLIYGQRRLQAATDLEWETIGAEVIDDFVPEAIGKALSDMENSHVKTSDADKRRLVSRLKEQGFSQNQIVKDLGISRNTVRLIFWEQDLIKRVNDARVKANVSVDIARKLQDRLTINGEVMVDQVVEFIEKMENLNDIRRKEMVEVLREDANLSADEADEIALENTNVEEYKITLSKKLSEGVKQMSQDTENSPEMQIVEIVQDRLESENIIEN